MALRATGTARALWYRTQSVSHAGAARALRDLPSARGAQVLGPPHAHRPTPATPAARCRTGATRPLRPPGTPPPRSAWSPRAPPTAPATGTRSASDCHAAMFCYVRGDGGSPSDYISCTTASGRLTCHGLAPGRRRLFAAALRGASGRTGHEHRPRCRPRAPGGALPASSGAAPVRTRSPVGRARCPQRAGAALRPPSWFTGGAGPERRPGGRVWRRGRSGARRRSQDLTAWAERAALAATWTAACPRRRGRSCAGAWSGTGRVGGRRPAGGDGQRGPPPGRRGALVAGEGPPRAGVVRPPRRGRARAPAGGDEGPHAARRRLGAVGGDPGAGGRARLRGLDRAERRSRPWRSGACPGRAGPRLAAHAGLGPLASADRGSGLHPGAAAPARTTTRGAGARRGA